MTRALPVTSLFLMRGGWSIAYRYSLLKHNSNFSRRSYWLDVISDICKGGLTAKLGNLGNSELSYRTAVDNTKFVHFFLIHLIMNIFRTVFGIPAKYHHDLGIAKYHALQLQFARLPNPRFGEAKTFCAGSMCNHRDNRRRSCCRESAIWDRVYGRLRCI